MKKIQNSCIFERKTFEMNHEEGCVSFGYSHISYMYIHDDFFFPLKLCNISKAWAKYIQWASQLPHCYMHSTGNSYEPVYKCLLAGEISIMHF